jgi:hypothetical protein
MPKFLIVYNIGYGEMADVIEAKDQAAADKEAYEAFRDAYESSGDYFAEPLTKDNAYNHGLEFEE